MAHRGEEGSGKGERRRKKETDEWTVRGILRGRGEKEKEKRK